MANRRAHLTNVRCVMDASCALNDRKRTTWIVGLTLVCLSIFARAADTEKAREISELRPLQAGITLPVAVRRTLRAGKVKPGTVFVLKTTQRVPVSEDDYLNRGAAVRQHH